MNYRRLGTMLDCSRNGVMNLPSLKRWIDITADLGYNMLMLYTEDTYEVEGEPYFGHLRGRYTREELQEIDEYAAAKGMELIPAIQTLAHLNAIFRWPKYFDIRDCDDILLVDDERTYTLIDNMFASLRKCLRTNIVNIGMDEAHMLGRGKYQDAHGVQDRFDILLRHLNRVAEIAAKYSFTCIMWGDMFVRLLGRDYYDTADITVPDKVKELIPANVELIYWDYYTAEPQRYVNNLRLHSAIKEGSWFAGGLWCWAGFAPHNRFSLQANLAALTACEQEGTQDVFFTMWGDNGNECSKFAMLPSLYATAEMARGNTDMDRIKAGFAAKYGIAFDDFMLVDLPGTANEPEGKVRDPEKYMLYNDCFAGLFDCLVSPGEGEAYAACAQRLQAIEGHGEFGYIFRTLRTLCETLGKKWDIGVRTRAAYLAGDRATLEVLVEEYASLTQSVETFYEAFRDQWYRDNKPQGFDVQDTRLGGLMQRIRHCRYELQRYLAGQTDSLPELEQPVLNVWGDPDAKEYREFNGWGSSITASRLD